MNPVVIQFANGNVFFIGLGTTGLAIGFLFCPVRRAIRIAADITWLTGICLVLLSAVAISPWLYALWIMAALGARIAANRPRRWKAAATSVFAAVSLALCLVELPFHLRPSIPLDGVRTVYVLGDSLSSGIGKNDHPWPERLQEISGRHVVNLARAGATVDAALRQADGVVDNHSLVIVEIGGDDLLGHTDSGTFDRQLDELLAKLHARGDSIAMFELPLLPFWNRFGSTQRSLARKYDVIMIPKSCLTSILAHRSNTVDGLHLSPSGHEALAHAVDQMLKRKN